VVDVFLYRWDDLERVAGTNGRKRFAVIACRSVQAVVVHGVPRDDGTVEVIDVELDLTPFDDEADEE